MCATSECAGGPRCKDRDAAPLGQRHWPTEPRPLLVRCEAYVPGFRDSVDVGHGAKGTDSGRGLVHCSYAYTVSVYACLPFAGYSMYFYVSVSSRTVVFRFHISAPLDP